LIQQGAESILLAHINRMASWRRWRCMGCTPRARIFHSTTSQRCSIGL